MPGKSVLTVDGLLREIDPFKFEELVAELFEEDGYEVVLTPPGWPSLRLSARVTAFIAPKVGMYAECFPAPPITAMMMSSAFCTA